MMLKKYNEFIGQDILTEALVTYSKGFRSILKRINSPVSKALLDIEQDDLDITSNYLDITDKPEYISFTPMKKYQKYLEDFVGKKVKLASHGTWIVVDGLPERSGFLNMRNSGNHDVFIGLEYIPNYNFPRTPVVPLGEEGEILKHYTSAESGVCYVKVKFSRFDKNLHPELKTQEGYENLKKSLERATATVSNGSIKYSITELLLLLVSMDGVTVCTLDCLETLDGRKLEIDPFNYNRQDVRIGKGVTGILASSKVKFKESEMEDFVNNFKYQIKLSKDIFRDFELVKGDDIEKWYHEDKHIRDCGGTLAKSCMRYERCQGYFDIYTQNPSVCSLLILKSENGKKIKGRALIWNLVDGKTYMDRIYTSEDSDILLFAKYAASNSWYRKNGNDNDITNEAITPEESETRLFLDVQLEFDEVPEFFPYLDTLAYFDTENFTLGVNKVKGHYKLRNTLGDFSVVGNCPKCKGTERIPCRDCVEGYNDCANCSGSGETNCRTCGGDGSVNCSTCDGDNEVDCTVCDGDGKVYCDSCDDGKVDCTNCDGDGCEECDETGRVNCSDCDGQYEQDCGHCEGSGSVSCDDCSWGTVECADCGGSGDVECFNCDGAGSFACTTCYAEGFLTCDECED